MTSPQRSHRNISLRRVPTRREGMVLVTVLMIVTLASMTAVYSVQGAAVEVQASGSMKTGMMAKATSESLVMVGAAAIDELDVRGSASAPNVPQMARYRLPNIVPDPFNRVGGLSLTTTNMQTTATPTEAMYRNPIAAMGTVVAPTGAVSPYLPTAQAIQESWPRANSDPGETGDTRRVAVTIFGELGLPGEAIPAGQVRALHDTVSISQAYYDTVIPRRAQ